ncbi:MAG: hypothetical protein M0R28_17850 [Pigmentiphaga sp.]|nr:hypothetical protein [Pigmentiphaga sp.]
MSNDKTDKRKKSAATAAPDDITVEDPAGIELIELKAELLDGCRQIIREELARAISALRAAAAPSGPTPLAVEEIAAVLEDNPRAAFVVLAHAQAGSARVIKDQVIDSTTHEVLTLARAGVQLAVCPK